MLSNCLRQSSCQMRILPAMCKNILFPHILNNTVYSQTLGSWIIWKVKTTVLVVLISLSTDSQLSSHLFKSSRTFCIYVYIFLHIDHGHFIFAAILNWIFSSIILPNCFNCVICILKVTDFSMLTLFLSTLLNSLIICHSFHFIFLGFPST